jgi:hypothetical protein
MYNVYDVADKADLIINGYAFTKVKEKTGENIRILNLNNPNRAAFINSDGEVLETSMDDIEIAIILDYYNKNRRFLEE